MLSQNDIIYFAITDRFSPGSNANNMDVDLKNPFAYHGGDFLGIIDKIPYLVNLGITALWITPVYINTHIPDMGMWGYHGYWPLDFERVDPRLYVRKNGIEEGSKLYLKELIDILHENGIKVILDMVVNHTGYNHPWLKDRPHWFNHESLQSIEEGRLMGLPDLDQDNIEVYDYFLNVVADWIEQTGIDCIRMDTAKHVERAFWYHFKTYVKGKHPDVSLLGEVLEWDINRISDYQKHFAFDYLFDFPLQQSMLDVFVNDRSLLTFARPGLSNNESPGILDKDTYYTNHNRLVTLLDNHDLPKRFISDTFDRYREDFGYAVKIYKLAMTFLFTTRGVPQIFYGNEIALEGYSDPDNRRDMPWELFSVDLEPSGEYPMQRDVFRYMKRLIEIRKSNEALTFGTLTTLFVDDFVYAYLREYRNNVLIVVMNNGHEPMKVPLKINIDSNSSIPPRVKSFLKDKHLFDQLDPSCELVKIEDGGFNIMLEGKSARVFKAQ